jgi:hypothetical protein
MIGYMFAFCSMADMARSVYFARREGMLLLC